jgi:hypothetical protein
MIKRRAKAAGVTIASCCHTFLEKATPSGTGDREQRLEEEESAGERSEQE